MRTNYPSCPNPECEYHLNPPPRAWYWRKGVFKTKWNQKRVPRFQCSKCHHTFSSHSFHASKGQIKPQLNEPIRKLLTEGMSVRGISRATGCSRSTVLRKLKFLGQLSEKVCAEQRKLPSSKTEYVQFDEMETFHKTRCLPLSLAIAVRPKTGEIVSIQVGTKESTSDSLKRLARIKYGLRENQKEKAVRAMLKHVREVVKDEKSFTIASDKWGEYVGWVKSELPFAKHLTHKADAVQNMEKEMKGLTDFMKLKNYSESEQPDSYWTRTQKNGVQVIKAYDPLFYVNQKCAKLRSSISRLRRETWGYTQKIENLNYHLWLFIAVNNGYKLPK